MGIKFESGKICVVCDQCDNNDFDFHNTENRELHAIKISSVDGREDCQHIETKSGTQACLGTTMIAVTILLILSILFSE